VSSLELPALLIDAGALAVGGRLLLAAGALVRDVAEIRRRLEAVAPQVAQLREEVVVLRSEQGHVAGQIDALRADVDDIREGAMTR
jgi:hypothetical protein